uniref:Uncharacterized protein n=1 Tax=Chromera velia CCMP2878 TaxID=1169474 RepID=A0A0G4H7M8_9ALVE|eukprot:Cvel_24969.t1-p1 / transcript=Cvel_24969.t1 / gene=Cvel_24969 / organism=Chromera_velia_CCMP2878 / gene_product=hypothetical protein / transcript_product=hypothetical protein / location=Cvel_scaffold2765:17074-20861(+) / protein_length=441 / sequence_SO=supercontig / SO=protein_coding / is_pseudo=false
MRAVVVKLFSNLQSLENAHSVWVLLVHFLFCLQFSALIFSVFRPGLPPTQQTAFDVSVSSPGVAPRFAEGLQWTYLSFTFQERVFGNVATPAQEAGTAALTIFTPPRQLGALLLWVVLFLFYLVCQISASGLLRSLFPPYARPALCMSGGALTGIVVCCTEKTSWVANLIVFPLGVVISMGFFEPIEDTQRFIFWLFFGIFTFLIWIQSVADVMEVSKQRQPGNAGGAHRQGPPPAPPPLPPPIISPRNRAGRAAGMRGGSVQSDNDPTPGAGAAATPPERQEEETAPAAVAAAAAAGAGGSGREGPAVLSPSPFGAVNENGDGGGDQAAGGDRDPSSGVEGGNALMVNGGEGALAGAVIGQRREDGEEEGEDRQEEEVGSEGDEDEEDQEEEEDLSLSGQFSQYVRAFRRDGEAGVGYQNGRWQDAVCDRLDLGPYWFVS